MICLFGSRVAHAQPVQAVCVDAAVTVSGPLAPQWARVVEDVCSGLHSLPDRDPQARVELAETDVGLTLTVRLADGRTAAREVSRPEDLRAAVEAVLTLPPAPAAPEVAPAEKTPLAPPPAPPAATPLADDKAPTAISFDLAALATSRLLGAPATFAPGVVVSGTMDVDHGWLVGLRARIDPALVNLTDDGEVEGGSFGGGVEGGRRVPIAGVLDLDLGLGVDGLADVPYTGHRGGDRRSDDATADLRTRAFARVLVTRRGAYFAGLLGFEVSPIRLADSDNNERPAYGGELGVGVGWGGS